MNTNFERIAPYLEDPLILIGFFIFLAFLFSRFLIKKGILKPLPSALSYRILRSLLLYGFIIGILLIILGYVLKNREIDNQRKTAELIESKVRDDLKDVPWLSEEKKNEIVNQIVKGYLDGAVSRERAEAMVEEIKTSLTQNSLESTPVRDQVKPFRDQASLGGGNPISNSPKLHVTDQLNNLTETRKEKENKPDAILNKPRPSNGQVSSSSVVLIPSESNSQQEEQPTSQQEPSTPQEDRSTPLIDFIMPRTLTSHGLDQQVTVSGSQFHSGLTVQATSPDGRTTFSGSQIRSVTLKSFVIVGTFNKLGLWSIRVYNPDGGRSNRFHFFVEAASGIFCGNGDVEWPEQCDDGNNSDGDGCSKDCRIEIPLC